MQTRRLGNTGIDVSVIGLGTVKFGRNQCVKYPKPFALPSDADLSNLLAMAVDCGINLLDTAPAYGFSEERLGKLLRGQRHTFVLSTKVGEEFVAEQSHFDFSPEAITKSVERSLQRMHTDYLDIVLVHSNGEDERIITEENVFLTLASLKAAGKIRAYGMSAKTIAGGLLTVQHADVAMVTHNVMHTTEREVITEAQKKAKAILIKKAFASGHLQTPAAENLKFILSEPGVTSVIIGTINPTHLKENCVGWISA